MKQKLLHALRGVIMTIKDKNELADTIIELSNNSSNGEGYDENAIEYYRFTGENIDVERTIIAAAYNSSEFIMPYDGDYILITANMDGIKNSPIAIAFNPYINGYGIVEIYVDGNTRNISMKFDGSLHDRIKRVLDSVNPDVDYDTEVRPLINNELIPITKEEFYNLVTVDII
jgi:hypothetical protein